MTLWRAMYIASTNPLGTSRIFRENWGAKYLVYSAEILWSYVPFREVKQWYPNDTDFYATDWAVFEAVRPVTKRISWKALEARMQKRINNGIRDPRHFKRHRRSGC